MLRMMSIDDVFRRYERILRSHLCGTTPAQLDVKSQRRAYAGWFSVVGHAAWLCAEARRIDDPDKRIRWLCWVQGVLVALGLRSLAAVRSDTRGIL